MAPPSQTGNMGTCPTAPSSRPLHGYQSYVEELRSLIADVTSAERSSDIDDSLQAALDGQAAESLRRLVPLDALCHDGVFLTSSPDAPCDISCTLSIPVL